MSSVVYLGLKVVARNRDVVEQGVGQDLSGLISFGSETAVTQSVTLKCCRLVFNFVPYTCINTEVGNSSVALKCTLALPFTRKRHVVYMSSACRSRCHHPSIQ